MYCQLYVTNPRDIAEGSIGCAPKMTDDLPRRHPNHIDVIPAYRTDKYRINPNN